MKPLTELPESPLSSLYSNVKTLSPYSEEERPARRPKHNRAAGEATAETRPKQLGAKAELTACVEALRAVPLTLPLRVIIDSKCVYDGVTVHRWALQGRQVVNQDLWDLQKLLIQSRSGATLWLHVYSHVGVVGNERADALANQGRCQHPAHLQMLRDLCAQQGQPQVVLS